MENDLEFVHSLIDKKEDWCLLPKNPLVTVIVAAYNHERYIRECLDGILEQKTDFEFEIIIKEDFSNDRTRSILLEYYKDHSGKIRLWICKENLYSQRLSPKLPLFARGKYAAKCDGDDYWTDSLKLQKQADFLDSNPQYGLVFTDFDQYFHKSGELVRSYNKSFFRSPPVGDVFTELLYVNPYVTSTAMYLTSVINTYTYEFKKLNIPTMDYNFWLHIAANWKIGYLHDSTTVYRFLSESASHFSNSNSENLYLDSQYMISKYFSEYYSIPLDERRVLSQIRRVKILRLIQRRHFFRLFIFWRTPLLVIKLAVYEIVLKPLIKFFNKGSH